MSGPTGAPRKYRGFRGHDLAAAVRKADQTPNDTADSIRDRISDAVAGLMGVSRTPQETLGLSPIGYWAVRSQCLHNSSPGLRRWARKYARKVVRQLAAGMYRHLRRRVYENEDGTEFTFAGVKYVKVLGDAAAGQGSAS